MRSTFEKIQPDTQPFSREVRLKEDLNVVEKLGVMNFSTASWSFLSAPRIKLRRTKLIGIYCVGGLCTLLTLILLHGKFPWIVPCSLSIHDTAKSHNIFDTSKFVSISDILTTQRAKIKDEMKNFDYPSGRFGIAASKLSDLTPKTGGIPVRSVVVTTWRSGSTFFGDIINSMPGSFYYYEPLLNFGIKQIRSNDEEEAVRNLKNLLNCNFNNDMADYLDFGKVKTHFFQHNIRLWSVCVLYPHFCWHPIFLTEFCRLFPLQIMKTVRLRLSSAEKLLDDKNLNVRVIKLVRDPRATMQSRRNHTWCAENPDCGEAALLCESLEADFISAQYFSKKYTSRFKAIRYEELSLNPYEMSQEILNFYGLPFDFKVQEFLNTHTKKNIGDFSTTFRDSKWTPFHWIHDLTSAEIMHIQKSCSKAMEMWGYRKMENFSNNARDFNPVILPPPFR